MRTLLLVAGTVPFLLLSPESAAAQAASQIRITASTANVRQGPGTDREVLGKEASGTVLDVTGAEGAWLRVRLRPEFGFGARSGYVHRSVTESVEEASARPAAAPAPAPPVPVFPSEDAVPARPPFATLQREPRDPGTAMLIGALIPGGGQFYAGETKRGAVLLGVGLGGLIVGSALYRGRGRPLRVRRRLLRAGEHASVAPRLGRMRRSVGLWDSGRGRQCGSDERPLPRCRSRRGAASGRRARSGRTRTPRGARSPLLTPLLHLA